jgi:ATP/ADP translocase
MMDILARLKQERRVGDLIDQATNYEIVLPIYVFGFITVVSCWGLRYSFFGPAKEIAFIPLGEDVRGKAKAAVDVLGSQFGKAGVSFRGLMFKTSIMFIVLNVVYDNTSLKYVHWILGVFTTVCFLWIWATISLGRQYKVRKIEWEREQADVQIEMKTDTEKN